MFDSSSRYSAIETAEWTPPEADSRRPGTITYVRRRFLPDPETFAELATHTVTEGDRLDNVTAAYLGAPELFWRLCDANNALHPRALTERIGRRLRIPLPEGGR
jgi:hypothetical protein